MKNTWRCFRGGSSSPESISSKNDGFDEQDPFSGNEIQKRDDRYPPDGCFSIHFLLRGKEMIRCPKLKNQQQYRILVDMALGNKFSEEGLERLFQAVRLCIEPDVSTRPNMKVVRAMVHEAATKRRSFD